MLTDAGFITILIIVVVSILFVSILFSFIPIGLWISALAAGVNIGIFTLVGMRLRRVVPVNRAEIPERRAMAIAHEQEMIASIQEKRALVVEAESKVPAALAYAFNNGNLKGRKISLQALSYAS